MDVDQTVSWLHQTLCQRRMAIGLLPFSDAWLEVAKLKTVHTYVPRVLFALALLPRLLFLFYFPTLPTFPSHSYPLFFLYLSSCFMGVLNLLGVFGYNIESFMFR